MKRCPLCECVYSDHLEFCSRDGAPLSRFANADPVLGHVIEDRYRLQEAIGRGGFGTVYRAAHQRLPIEVAVKVLHAGQGADQAAVDRFTREVHAAAKVRHPNVAEVLDFGFDAKLGYFVAMPLLRGETLAAALNRRRMSLVEAHTVFTQTALGLAAAHQVGVVHRDVKPDNLFLATDPTAASGWIVKVLDFGVAKIKLDSQPTADSPGGSKVLGTPAYMAPEHATGAAVDARVDVYGLGLVLCLMLCGTTPFSGTAVPQLVARRLLHDPEPPSRMGVGGWIPKSVDKFVLSLIARSPDDRPASMEAALQGWLAVQVDATEAWASAFLGGGAAQNVIGVSDMKTETLPTAAAAPQGISSHSSEGGMRQTSPAILVVDDDEAMRYLMRAVIQAAGWACETADSASAALDFVLGDRPVCGIIIDVLMPGMHGLDLLKLLRKAGYDGPIVFCSALSSDSVRAELTAHGAGYVNKATEIGSIVAELKRMGVAPPH